MNEDIAAPICAKIKELRLARGWSQEHLGKLTGIHRPIVSRIEKGWHCPALPTLVQLAKVFEVPVTTLVAPLDTLTIAEEPTTRAELAGVLEAHEFFCLDNKEERAGLLSALIDKLGELQRKAWFRP